MEQMSHAAILVVDDETDFTNTLAEVLARQDCEVHKAFSGQQALQALDAYQFDLVILDLLMPLIQGLEILKKIKHIDRSLPIIVLTADHKPESVAEAMQLGAYDYLHKPVDWTRLHVAVKNALTTRDLQEEVAELRDQLRDRYGFASVVGGSDSMQRVFRALERIIDSSVPVSLRGEAGTGKELLARTIHFNGPRRHQPFVAVHCAAIPEKLLQAELFGQEKGAPWPVIGAGRVGKFEQARGGTIFLDEVGELSPSVQVKILRVLKERSVERLAQGGQEPMPVDVRVISASTKNLEEEMEAGRLREDLYYRLCVYAIFVPALRERKDDIPALAEHFLQAFSRQHSRPLQQISSQTMDCLLRYHWPGNVSELANVIERSLLNADGGLLLPEHLSPTIAASADEVGCADGGPDLKAALSRSRQIIPLREIEKALLRQALKITNYNMSSAANELGIGRTTLYRKLQKYQIPLPR